MVAGILLVVVSAIADGGCAKKADDAPPVATPTVTFDRNKLPVGSVASVTYKFVVADGATFDKDYLVFAQFKDADGQIMWDDDHHPPTPTSGWKPGQTIEYSRTVFVPLLPYAGEATMELGLYSPNADGARLPLAGEDVGHRAYRAARFELLPQSESLHTVDRDGWYRAETAKPGGLTAWRWTRGEAALGFNNAKKDLTLYLDVDSPGSPYPSQEVRVMLGGQAVDTFSVVPTERQLRKIKLPATLMGTAEMAELRLVVDKTFVPAQVSPATSRDARVLGICVFHLYIDTR
jgi:hypothetical protein